MTPLARLTLDHAVWGNISVCILSIASWGAETASLSTMASLWRELKSDTSGWSWGTWQVRRDKTR